MDSDWKDLIGSISIFLITAAIVVGITLGMSRYNCYYQYRDFNPSWRPISGCMVVYEGKNVPSDSLRVMD